MSAITKNHFEKSVEFNSDNRPVFYISSSLPIMVSVCNSTNPAGHPGEIQLFTMAVLGGTAVILLPDRR